MLKKKYTAHNGLLPFYLSNQIGNSNYNLCFSYTLENSNQVERLVQKVQTLIRLQAHLRQTFSTEHNELIAYIHSDLPAEIHYINSSNSEIIHLEDTLANETHDMSSKSSIKLNIIKISNPERYVVFFNIHHILMDGESIDRFIDDLNALLDEREICELTADTYISHMKQETNLTDLNEDNSPSTRLYTQTIEKISENALYTNKADSDVLYYTELLPQKIYESLRLKSSQMNISVFNLLLLGWAIFIAKLNNQKSTLVSYPVNIRAKKDIRGCLVNTIILPLETHSDDSFFSIIHRWSDKKIFLKTLSRLKFNLSIEAISSFAYSNFAKPKDLIVDNIHFLGESRAQIANAILSIKYKEHQNSLFFSADVLSKIYPKHVADSLLLRFFNFLSKLLENTETLLKKIDLTFEDEKNRMLYQWNKPTHPISPNKTLIDLFEAQVKKTPHRIAVVFEGIVLTYTQLNEKANQLAHYLSEFHQIKPDDLVALLLDRNEHTIISILAVLKAGGAYVPIDLSYPSERIDHILEDTQTNIILVNESHQDRLIRFFSKKPHINVIPIDSDLIQKDIAHYEKNNIINASTGENLAYVIYTSGTTGRPKGVMIEHKCVINTLVTLIQDVYKNPEKETNHPLKISAFTSYAFDVSVSEFFVPLITGNELHILSTLLRKDILLTSQYINTQQINYVYLPPVLLANLPRIKHPSLMGIIYAGEPCDQETACYWSQQTNLYNYYGPTEASIYATGLQLQKDEVELIGKPIQNVTTYILNINKMPQPIGIIGELYIGGAGLAKGYLNQKMLTKEKFVINPYQTKKEKALGTNARLYKTGDLVRFTPDGHIEYIGRNDFQVKVRGHRIELGEIEQTILKYPGIKQVFVMLNKHAESEFNNINDYYLVSYYIANNKIEESALEEYLSLHLPDFMIPDILMQLDHFPLNANGKMDKGALPSPDFGNTKNYSPPTNEQEKIVCDAYSKVLSINKVGIYDNFFKIGGNSIRAISLVTKLQSNFDISIMDIYNFKIPKKIADNVLATKNNLKINLEKIEKKLQKKNKTIEKKKLFQPKIDEYWSKINQLQIYNESMPIDTILLTGATGFLGCNLLNTLLSSTQYSIFLIVRANSDEDAFHRVNQKFMYYFTRDLTEFLNIRLFVYAGDIEKSELNLSTKNYQMLVNQIDSIIHAAALTKHYGDYDEFYSSNVQATINLLNLSKLTQLKNFHYISTVSVLNEGYTPNYDYYVFTEEDSGGNLKEHSNVYIKTKYEGEAVVIKYREHGVNSNIYRVGNLAFILSNYRAQENIEENAFFTRIKCLIDLHMISKELALEEISPVDLTAEAIITLFDKKISLNQTFHVFNHELYNMQDVLQNNIEFSVKTTTINQFINTIIHNFDNIEHQQLVERYLLHMGWLNETANKKTQTEVLQDRTRMILKKLGFVWPDISNQAIATYLLRNIKRGEKK